MLWVLIRWLFCLFFASWWSSLLTSPSSLAWGIITLWEISWADSVFAVLPSLLYPVSVCMFNFSTCDFLILILPSKHGRESWVGPLWSWRLNVGYGSQHQTFSVICLLLVRNVCLGILSIFKIRLILPLSCLISSYIQDINILLIVKFINMIKILYNFLFILLVIIFVQEVVLNKFIQQSCRYNISGKFIFQ